MLVLAGKNISIFSPEINLIVLCLNGTKECWQTLNRICDIAEFIRSYQDIDWEKFIYSIDKLGCQRLVFIGMLLANDLLEISLPEIIWQRAQSDKAARAISEKVKKRLFSANITQIGEVETTMFHIATRELWSDKIKSFIGLMNHSGWITPTEKDRNYLPLPNFLFFLYYIIRPIRTIDKYGLIILRNFLQ